MFQVAATKGATEGEFHQAPAAAAAFFEQGAWQQNSPFGILPHESVVTTTASKTSNYENFNANLAAAQSLNHINTQLVAIKAAASRAQSPQVSNATAGKTNTSQTTSATFFQVK